MDRIDYVKIAGQNGSSNLYCLSLEADYSGASGGKATVNARLYMYCTWTNTPYTNFRFYRNLKINGVTKYSGNFGRPKDEQALPYTASDWEDGTWSIGGTTYKQRALLILTSLSSQSVTYGYGVSKKVTISAEYDVTATKTFLPKEGDYPLSGSITLPAQTAPTPSSCSVSVSSIDKDSAILSASVGGTYTEIQYKNSIDNTWQSSATMSNLIHNTSYGFYARARNQNSSWVESSIVYGTTLGDNPVINSISFTDIDRTVATLNLAVTYDTNAIFDQGNYEWGEIEGSYSYSGTSTNLTDLTPNTLYYVRARVKDNWDRWSDYIYGSFTSSGNAPIINAVEETVGRTTVTLTPDVTYDIKDGLGTAKVVYGEDWGETTTITKNTAVITLSNLTPNTNYIYQFNITSEKNRISNYFNDSFKTIGFAPNISAMTVDEAQTTAFLNPTVEYDTNDSLGYYVIVYGKTSYEKTTNSLTLTDLEPETSYLYKICAVGIQGLSSNIIQGNFTTCYATQEIQDIYVLDNGSDFIRMGIEIAHPHKIDQLLYWLYKEDGITVEKEGIITGIHNIKEVTEVNLENLEPKKNYIFKAQLKTIGVEYDLSNLYSSIRELNVETTASAPFTVIAADGTEKRYNGYVLGSGNIYNPYNMMWQNGYYLNGNIGDNINTLLNIEEGACSLTSIPIIPGVEYSITNEEDNVKYIIHITDNLGIIKQNTLTIEPKNSFNFIGESESKKLWISIISDTEPINKLSAKFFKLNIFRTIPKTPIGLENIVYINGKIRYIDIIQSGNSIDNNSHIIELKVFNKEKENVALGKPTELISGSSLENAEYITDGDISEDKYATIIPSDNLETIVRVDLGKEYNDIDSISLWRYYKDNRIYYNTRVYGRDAALKLTWKFHSYKIDGEYIETQEGANFYVKRENIANIPVITNILIEPNNTVYTLDSREIIVEGDIMNLLPPVIDNLISYRTDAILSARQGKILKSDIGILDNLITISREDIVQAINEIYVDYNGSTSLYSNIIESLLEAPFIK